MIKPTLRSGIAPNFHSILFVHAPIDNVEHGTYLSVSSLFFWKQTQSQSLIMYAEHSDVVNTSTPNGSSKHRKIHQNEQESIINYTKKVKKTRLKICKNCIRKNKGLSDYDI